MPYSTKGLALISKSVFRALVVAAVTAALVAVPAATAVANHPYSVLVAYADSSPPTTLQTALQAQPSVSNVVLFNASTGTPTPAQLSGYDIVVTFGNGNYLDPIAIGSNLALYATQGGVVIELAFDGYGDTTHSPQGLWVSAGFTPWTPNSTVHLVQPNTLGTFDATHPLMKGVSALNGDMWLDVTPAVGATQVAAWSTPAASLVVFKNRAVGINSHLGSTATWSGDFAKVIVNAGDWLYPHPPPPPPVPPADVVAPSVLSIGLVKGTVSYGLSEAATVKFTVERAARGRKQGRKCVAPSRRNRRGGRCTRYVAVGSFSKTGKAGLNSFRFAQRLRGKKLRPNRYRLALVATDAAGNKSVAKRVGFRVVRAGR
jgi:hypothetical protein